VAKFRGDRPRELGDYALKKKKKHHEHFIRPPVTPYGRPNKCWCQTFVNRNYRLCELLLARFHKGIAMRRWAYL